MAPHPTALGYFGLMALGFGVGTYATFVGTGGGCVLMPMLLLLYPHESPSRLTSISLAVVFFTAFSGSTAYAHMKRIDYKSGLIFGVAAMLGGIMGVLTTGYVSRSHFNVIFGVFLLIIGTVLIVKPKSARSGRIESRREPAYRIDRRLTTIDGDSFEYSYNPIIGIGLSFFAGYLAGFFGIGGGVIYVPLMAFLLNFPVHIATATSEFVLAILTFTGTITHIWMGSFHHGVHRIVALGVGVLVGGQMGAYLSSKVRGTWIIRTLAIGVIVLGIRVLGVTFW
jgi:uncharacterized membrane protein YfcA